MAQSGYTPIQLYYSTTAAAVPVNTNLANGELAINITDGKLYYKDNGGTVRLLASNATSAPVLSFSAGTTGFTPNTATSGAITLAGTLATTNGGTGLTSFTSGGVVYASSTSALATGSALTFDGTNLGIGASTPTYKLTLANVSTVAAGITLTTSSPVSYMDYTSLGLSGTWQGAHRFYVSLNSATPVLAYTIDANGNSIWSPSGTEGMRLNSTGLGIGTSSPYYKLTFANTAAVTTGITMTTSSPVNYMDYNSLGISGTWQGAHRFYVSNNSATPVLAAIIDSSANVGIGTSSPTRQLQVSNATNAVASVICGAIEGVLNATTSSVNVGAASNHALTISTNGTARFQVGTAGQLGIGGATYGTSGQVLTSGGSSAAPTWTTVSSGSGDVVGPASATANGIALFNSTTGKLIKDSAASDGLIYGLTVGRGGGAVGTNTAVGLSAMAATATGGFNSAFGRLALTALTSGASNTGIGNSALNTLSTASDNTAVGTGALYTSNGAQNTAVGTSAAFYTSSGSSITAMGWNALLNNTTGNYNTAVGHQALLVNTTASDNTAVGYNAARDSTAGNITAIGAYALRVNSTGTANVALGYTTMVANTTGASNTGLGYQALYSNTTASNNTAVGYQAGYANTTGTVTALGAFALNANTTGASNVAVGGYDGTTPSALRFNTTGSSNVAMGVGALQANTTASNNTAVGYQALYSSTTATSNTAVGHQAMYSNTTGIWNTAIGGKVDGFYNAALYSNTTGSYNTAVGQGALTSNTTATSNTGIGYTSLLSVTTGTLNTALGGDSGQSTTTGSANTFVGYKAGTHANPVTTGNHNTYIGAYSRGSAGTNTGEVVLGYDIAGKGTDTTFIRNPCYQGNNTTTWSTISDRRLKKNIVDNNSGLDKLTQIQVRNFEYRVANEVTELPQDQVIKKTGVQLGVIAQELQAVLPECVKQESTGVLSVDTDNLTWYLINAIKELKAEVDSLKSQLKGA